jgi:hypothetical protein
MKNVFPIVLMSVAVVLTIFSCATVPKEPLGVGELRLSSIQVPQMGTLSANVEYFVTINFEANGNPEINRACFYFSGDGRNCVDVRRKDMIYGPHANFRVPIHVPLGSYRLECYAEYIRNGETQRTNTLSSYVIGYEGER